MSGLERTLDSRRFKLAASSAVVILVFGVCLFLAQHAVSYQRGVKGAMLYTMGDPPRAYPYLVRAARAGLLNGFNAAPMQDLGEVALWAIDDPRLARYHREMTPRLGAHLAFVSFAQALARRPTSTTAMAGIADLARRVQILELKEGVPNLSEIVPPRDETVAIEVTQEDRLVDAAYRKAIEMEPNNYFWYAYLADFLRERGRRDEALPLYAKAIELMPDLGWHYYLGTSGPLPEDLFETALEGLTRALRTNRVHRPEKIESNIGYLYERQRDYDEALVHYGRAIEMAPDPSQYLYQAGAALTLQDRLDEAREYFRRALARGTLSRRVELSALQYLGRNLMQAGEPSPAVGYWEQAKELSPTNYEVRLNLGRALEQAGRLEDAEAEYRGAMTLDARRDEAFMRLIGLYENAGDFAKAIPLARRLLERHPAEAWYREKLDILYRRMGTEPPN